MPENISITKMTREHLPSIAELYTMFWNDPQSIDKMKDTLMQMENSGNHFNLVILVDAEVAGTISATLCLDLYGNCQPYAVVENFIISSKYRRMGLGRQLMQAMEALLKTKNCTQMILVTEVSRKDACGFYTNYGFQATHAGFKKKL
jgi:GNAT superfamily N-acetyltransferase